MRLAHIDCFCGAAGDMILGACVDAGLDVKDIEKGLRGLGLRGWKLEARPVTKGSLGATKVDVVIGRGRKRTTEHEHLEAIRSGRAGGHGHGHHDGMALRDILGLLRKARLPLAVRDRAMAAFMLLGQAESRVHRTPLQDVHFHEVGAIDSIVDVTGGVLAFHLLGVGRVTASPFPVSHGHIHCRHGILPVPGPATLEILKGVPTAPIDVEGETLTPTGAALVRTLAEGYGAQPAMTVEAVGYGAGDSDFPGRPNVLRLVLGESAADGQADEVWVVETNLDNVSPEVVGYALERCFAAGAVDAFTTPIQMKKNRPAVMLTALVPPSALEAVEKVLFRETRTLGIRRHLAQRTKLARESAVVKTRFGPIHVKVGRRDGIRTANPEYEDCRRAAEKSGEPLNSVYEEAVKEFRSTREE